MGIAGGTIRSRRPLRPLLVGFSLTALVLAPLGIAATDGGGETAGSVGGAPTCMGEEATILGSPGSDRGKKKIVGTRSGDVIVSFGGRDLINAKGGPDLICSGRGADTVRGGGGDDEVAGGAGKDKLKGNRADDQLDGQRGKDALNGGPGSDWCRGGKGKDTKRNCELSGGKPTDPPPIPPAPVANDDQASTDEDSAKTIDVLANDDAKGRGMKVVAVNDSGALGSASIKGAGVEYDPGASFQSLGAGQSDSDSFTYTIESGDGKRDSAVVDMTVTGVDDPSKLTAAPELFPDYSPQVGDYVTRCNGSDDVGIGVVAGAGNSIDVDGQGAKGGSFNATVPLGSNQRFSFTRSTPTTTTTHHVRCLPTDFPQWNFEKFGASAWQWYIVRAGDPDYGMIFDGNGVPLWWFKGAGGDAKYLSDGTLAWAAGTLGADPRYQIRALDGSLLNTIRTVDTELDDHDLQLLPNGNYMVMSYKPRAGTVDLTPYGTAPDNGPADGAVLDAELQEVTPAGDLVWSWNSETHIDLAETDHWWDDFVIANPTRFGPGHDVVHINSIEALSDSIVVSMRHTDAVYKIDRTTGDIVWKLGGTDTPESLAVVGDPLGDDPLGGQHDARILPDGTLTVHDNGTNKSRAPRAVRYAIDESAGTATLLESVSDPDAPGANCCGSARRSDSGSWVASWGGLGTVPHPISEFAADGSQTFKLLFPGDFSYRANPVPFGELGRADLRTGMDTQFPR